MAIDTQFEDVYAVCMEELAHDSRFKKLLELVRWLYDENVRLRVALRTKQGGEVDRGEGTPTNSLVLPGRNAKMGGK